jgi:hypothetical protein
LKCMSASIYSSYACGNKVQIEKGGEEGNEK